MRYRVELTGPVPFQIDLVEGDQVGVEAADETPAQVVMRCEAELT